MKICPLGANLFYVDTWTDMAKPIFTYHNFENMPKNVVSL